jgi:mRNA interferase MazF
MFVEVKRGDIYLTELPLNSKSVQTGMRPVVIVSNELCNKYSPTITVVPITSNINKNNLPTHVSIGSECGLIKPSLVLAEQILTISRELLQKRLGSCPEEILNRIDRAMQVQLEHTEPFDEERAYQLLRGVQNTNKIISRDGEINAENNMVKKILVDEFKWYCNRYGMDHQTIIDKYNNEIAGRRKARIA